MGWKNLFGCVFVGFIRVCNVTTFGIADRNVTLVIMWEKDESVSVGPSSIVSAVVYFDIVIIFFNCS